MTYTYARLNHVEARLSHQLQPPEVLCPSPRALRTKDEGEQLPSTKGDCRPACDSCVMTRERSSGLGPGRMAQASA